MLIRDLFNVQPRYYTNKDIGFELEVEGRNLPHDVRDIGFRREHDGSLRGEENAEYVFDGPVELKEAVHRITSIYRTMRMNEAVIDESVRAGIHVHVNMQNEDYKTLFNLIVLYYAFENMLTKMCGDGREGNLFCLRAGDAKAIVAAISNAISSADMQALRTDDLRYAALNVTSLFKYGSVEFRAMRTTPKVMEVVRWVKLVHQLREAARTFNNPTEVVEHISVNEIEGFTQRVFGQMFKYLKLYDGWEKDVMKGVRLAQHIAYAADWDKLFQYIEIGGLKFPKRDGVVYEEPLEDF